MRSIVQRVSSASVSVDGKVVGKIGSGLVVLCAAHVDDTEASAAKMADRVWGCRIFSDAEGKMNLALRDLVKGEGREAKVEGRGGQRDNGTEGKEDLGTHSDRPSTFNLRPSVLAVSNFTVYGDTTQRRPSFVQAASYERGRELFDRFVEELRKLGCHVETGEFGAHMEVSLVNDGPVTVILET